MKLKNFLNEVENIDDETFILFSEFIKVSKLCSDAFSDMFHSRKVLLRGTNNDDLFYHRKKYKELRYPKDTSKKIDKFFEIERQKHYFKFPSRQQSVFCVMGIYLEAEEDSVKTIHTGELGYYGSYLVVVIPENGYNLFQSYHEKDFTESHLHYIIKLYLREQIEKYYGKENISDILYHSTKYATSKQLQSWTEEMPPHIKEEFDKYFTGTDDIRKLKAENEIIIEHNGYYAFSIEAMNRIQEVALNNKISIFDREFINILKKM